VTSNLFFVIKNRAACRLLYTQTNLFISFQKEFYMKKTVFLALAVLLLASLACNFGVSTSPAAPAASQNVLFQDDFSNTSSGWDQASGDNGSTDYNNGTYRINVVTTQYDAWANPGKSFDADMIVEVDAVKAGGPDANDFGVICRYNQQDGGIFNFYYFIIGSDGYAAIYKMVDSSATALSEQTGVSAIKASETNHLRAECVGSNLTLYVNGQKILSASDSDLTGGGDAGLLAGTFDTAGTDITFDNFLVAKP